MAARALDRDGVERDVHALHRVADRVRELRVDEQELRDPVRLQIRREHLAIRVERRAAGEQRNPVEIVRLVGRSEVRVEQHRHGAGALGELSELNEAPPFAVRHRRLADAVEAERAFPHGGHEPHHRLVVFHVVAEAHRLVIHAVELLPHLGADFLAHLRRVLARGRQARDDGRAVGDVGGQPADGVLRIGARRASSFRPICVSARYQRWSVATSTRLSIRLCVASITRAQLSARSK